MDYRNLLVAAVLAAGLTGFAGTAQPLRAEIIATDNGIAVKQPDIATPTRGMTMNEVAKKFGAPVNKIPAVGKPPISRWDYPEFVVYFENDRVIDSVVANS
ncbi:MAG: hypothetical protein ACLPTF_07900 [Steroidobacteraceae bacterium]